MGPVAGYAVLCAAPALAFWVLVRGLRWLSQTDRLPWEPAGVWKPANRPIQQLAADLRRLDKQRRLTGSTSQPARKRRLTAVELAYDDVLLSCCAALDVPMLGHPPLSDQQRVNTEIALREAGLRW